MKRAVILVGSLLATSVGSGCSYIPSVGPDYQEPQVVAPSEWLTKTASFDQQHELEAQVAWWQVFGDETLSKLIAIAQESNFDLKIALSRVRESRAQLRIATADFYPSIGANGGFERTAPSAGSFGGLSRALGIYNQYSAGFDASWEIDIFGGVRREREAAFATLEAVDANYADTMISLLAEVARTYFSYKSLSKRLLVNRRNLEAQEESLALVNARFEAGLVSELDVVQSRALVETTRSQIPQLEDVRVGALNQLSILLGKFPADTRRLLDGGAPQHAHDELAQLPSQVVIGVPSDLLRRRPDIRALERELAAQTARVGVAVSDLFPKFSLTGQYGVASLNSGSLFDRESRTWMIGPSVRLPLFEGGRIISNIDVQNERMEQSLMRYEQGIIAAVTETESALASYERQQERRRALSESFRASSRALELSRDLYQQGVADFQRVLDAERAMLISDEGVVVAEESTVAALIAIYKALGGGWGSPAAVTIPANDVPGSSTSAPKSGLS